MENWSIAIPSLLGVVVGAVLQFWLGRAAERRKHVDDLRSQAYADYLRAVAAAAHLRSDEDLRDAHRDAAHAKARIAVHGTASVLCALARFEECGASIIDRRSAESFVSLVAAMRTAGDRVSEKVIHLVLIGPEKSK